MNPITSTVTSGIKTREQGDNDPYGHIVEWIEWNSGFRNGNLQHADIIIGVNDKKYVKENRVIDRPKAIGNYLESAWWVEQGIDDGQTITLHIFREGQTLSVTGKIQQQQLYFNADNRQTIGLNGPTRMSNDGFSSAWGIWYERFVTYASLYLDDKRWERSVLDNRRLLEEHDDWKKRIDYLVKHYPGQFANTVISDWEKVRGILEGILYTDITAETMEYRKLGEQRALLVKEAAVNGRNVFLSTLSATMIPAFPAVDPVHGDIPKVAGKIIALPAITYNHFINDLGKSYAVIGSHKEGYYFIHLNSKEMDVFFKTLFYYQAQVTPVVAERYQFYAEILNEPALLTYEGRPVTGVMVKVVAGMAGEDNVFIDLRKTVKDGRVSFEGAEVLTIFSDYTVDDTASPKQIVEAMIHYIKQGNMAAWKKLFCSWQIYSYWEGPPFMDMAFMYSEEAYQRAWEQSRRQILNAVYDVRVLYVGNVKTIIGEDKKNGVPRVDQVKVIIDHIGQFDGIYRSSSNLYVHRKWVLQRLNGGPWKIKELQPL